MAAQLQTLSKWHLIGGPLLTGDKVLKRSLGLQPFLFPSYTLANEMSGFALLLSVTMIHCFTTSPKW